MNSAALDTLEATQEVKYNRTDIGGGVSDKRDILIAGLEMFWCRITYQELQLMAVTGTPGGTVVLAGILVPLPAAVVVLREVDMTGGGT